MPEMVNENPTVSIIIPTYNRAHLVGRAIQSVLNQTYQDFEIIVVDDGSVDNTEEIVGEFQRRDKRVKYLKHKVNKGGSAARNTGIKASRGEYIAFLDSDDEWLPRKLQLQMEVFQKSPSRVGAVYTAYVYVKDSGKEINEHKISKNGNIHLALLQGNIVGTTSTLLIKRSCFEKVGLFDERLKSCQDWDMWLRISSMYDFEGLSRPLVKFYTGHQSIFKNPDAVLQGGKIILAKYKSELLSQPKIYAHHMLQVGRLCIYYGSVREGRLWLKRALKYNPFNKRCLLLLIMSYFGARQIHQIAVQVERILRRIYAMIKGKYNHERK